jgi:AcrR family transcriptional regulator
VIDVHDPELSDERVVTERIVRGAIDAHRQLAFHDVDSAAIAERSGVTPEQVDASFPNRDALLMVTYDRWVELRGTSRAPHRQPRNTVEYVRMTLAEDLADPGLVRILAGAINIAAADTAFAALFRQRYEEYSAAMVAGLTRDFQTGAIASVVPPEQAATQLLAVYQGLQMQLLVRPHIDVLQQYDFAAQTLVEGWHHRQPRSWDLDAG